MNLTLPPEVIRADRIMLHTITRSVYIGTITDHCSDWIIMDMVPMVPGEDASPGMLIMLHAVAAIVTDPVAIDYQMSEAHRQYHEMEEMRSLTDGLKSALQSTTTTLYASGKDAEA